MSIPEVINAFAGWNITVTPEQLKNPSPDFVEGLYCACLQQATDLTHESLREPSQIALNASQVDEKDLYETALASNILLYHLTRFAKAARVDDFNAQDVFAPQQTRTMILLSAFINFIRFTEQFCDTFLKDLRDRSDAIIIQRNNAAVQLRDIQGQYDELSARIAKDKPMCEKLNAENTTLSSTMLMTKDAQTKAVRDVEQYRADRNELINRKEILNSEIKTLEDSIQRTRSRIVQSPERIKKTISIMSNTAMEDKKTVAMQEAKSRDLQAKINALHNIEKDVRGCIEQIQSIEREVQSLELSQKALGELRYHLEEKVIERNELRSRQERVNDQLANANLKLERAKKHAEEKKTSTQKTIVRLQQEYSQMVIERRENDKQIEEVRDEANQVEASMHKHLKQSEVELNELLAEYWRLRHETDVYMETLANKLNMRVVSE
ncbi:putative kinetochore protein NUF2 [Psilocybe cubensis]|uniref:Kinetochore protein NUF2 n=2 Tax=Psilocybe cubensis TaxID=181762 RepID=A0A8H7Y0J0_PSICU|nr:putative kinetochore protein NUF2 [Psilocybe cubensis]KAH9483845.1 putative kinetochore protein NUF2 [Psilocybe cubensis]